MDDDLRENNQEFKDLTILDTPPEPDKDDGSAIKESVTVFRERMSKIFAEVYSQSDPQLPLLPEKYKNFAFRWATEFRSNKQWADIFHVASSTIEAWKRNPKILRYYIIIRKKHNLLVMERMKLLEERCFQKLYEMLDLPVTDKNFDAMGKMIMKILGMDIDGNFNLRVTAESSSSSAGEKAVTKVEASIDVDQLRERLDEISLLEQVVKGASMRKVGQDVQQEETGSSSREALQEGPEGG